MLRHFFYTPFTGLGNFQGFRGNNWLGRRIQIFHAVVVPSLVAQTDKDFILWVSWRPQERENKQVQDLKEYLDAMGLKNVFTYGGVVFWDDKYSDEVAYDRLIM